ncbi:MAG: hypothetical protein EOP61_33445 [Sphingomonadales bacterium]|nr:MAG: hypothetical protein EOP61_33445 [Sphingomonadales bacterium]
MMRWVLAALAVIAVPAQAQSDDAAIRGIVRSIYAGYQTKAVSPNIKEPRATPRFAAVEKQCAATARLFDKKEPDASYGYCANDYGVWCQCQDFEGIDFAKMKVDVKLVGANADATLWFTGGKDPDLRLSFKRIGKAWALDDIWEYNRLENAEGPPDEASYRKRLVLNINEMREMLKQPVWAEPKG